MPKNNETQQALDRAIRASIPIPGLSNRPFLSTMAAITFPILVTIALFFYFNSFLNIFLALLVSCVALFILTPVFFGILAILDAIKKRTSNNNSTHRRFYVDQSLEPPPEVIPQREMNIMGNVFVACMMILMTACALAPFIWIISVIVNFIHIATSAP